ncbi:MAG TPA: RNA polymerase sigma factor [Solirubrobacteraceae bacterium]|jgi:RNA polymerase sigma factor (sigma-70 family)|nr:RNA polymerase sigma factor [Solirubrobacteraceae bacterium]
MSPRISTRLLATQSDERLVALVGQGHERAFEAFVHRYRRQLLSYCRRLGLTEARAEDVLQLALLKSWIALREGADVSQPKAWLYRIVHNVALNAMRDAAREPDRVADPSRWASARESEMDRGLITREALTEVASLPPLQREAIIRTAVVGHSHEQVATDLGITHSAVRGLVYRARVALRTAATALTPTTLLQWIAGGSGQSAPAPERLAELAAGGGTAGLGGLLLKGGAVAATAGTLIAGAVVHTQSHAPPRQPRRTMAAHVAPPHTGSGGPVSEGALTSASRGELAWAISEHRIALRVRTHRRPLRSAVGVGGRPGHGSARGGPLASVVAPTPKHHLAPSPSGGLGNGGSGSPNTAGAWYVEQRAAPPRGAPEHADRGKGPRQIDVTVQSGDPGQTVASGQGDGGGSRGDGGSARGDGPNFGEGPSHLGGSGQDGGSGLGTGSNQGTGSGQDAGSSRGGGSVQGTGSGGGGGSPQDTWSTQGTGSAQDTRSAHDGGSGQDTGSSQGGGSVQESGSGQDTGSASDR